MIRSIGTETIDIHFYLFSCIIGNSLHIDIFNFKNLEIFQNNGTIILSSCYNDITIIKRIAYNYYYELFSTYCQLFIDIL